MHRILEPQLSAAEALAIVQQRTQTAPTAQPQLSYFPLTGVVLQLVAARGPARALDGNLFHCVVDRVSGTPLLTTDWFELSYQDIDPPVGAMDVDALPMRMSVEEAVQVARQTVYTKLLRRLKLASRIPLEVYSIDSPLWKPNWLIRTSSQEFLVDALNGNVVTRTLMAT